VDIVIPTIGRPSLLALLERLEGFAGRVIVVDDRRRSDEWFDLDVPAGVELVEGRGRGPAAARNDGWRHATAPWVAFLDDDVVPATDWEAALRDDLDGWGPEVAGSQGRILVPRPVGRRPTDDERNVAGLETARWATADLTYRRAVLAAVGGFDERFPRAYREDADLGLRIVSAGWQIRQGLRTVTHPVRTEPWWASLRRQRGNRDDALMRRLHGRRWRHVAGAPPGRLRRHALTTTAAASMLVAAASGHRRAALGAAALWAALVGELAHARIAPGPRQAREVLTMVATSILMGPLAVVHRLAGELDARRLARRPGPIDVHIRVHVSRRRPVPPTTRETQLRTARVPAAVG
jgi:GT2 family glycosyltransferase